MSATTEPPDDLLPPGTPIDRDNCHREPIRTPGAVQGHGVLLAADGAGTVVQASTNTALLFAGPVLGAPLGSLIGDDVAARARERARADAPNLRPERAQLGARDVDVFAYTDGAGGLVVELEPVAPGDPGDVADFQSDLAGALGALQDVNEVGPLLERAVTVVRELTGFDRVWAYRFEPDDHGVIVAEDKVNVPDVPSFLGLHYPATDIPVQARALFLVNRVRLIADAFGEPAALEPVVNPNTGGWIDMTPGVLRAVSPMHIQYLQNMGATASMSIALEVGGRLWGLLSAHHYHGPKLLSQRARAACELLGRVCSVQLSVAEELASARTRADLAHRRAELLERVSTSESVTDGIGSDALLAVCGAQGAAIRVGSVVRTYGQTPTEADVARLLDPLPEETFATDRLGEDLPDHAGLVGDSAGVLAIPLGLRTGNALVWFRPEWVHTVTWGGKEAVGPADGTTLNPEASWREWVESVSGRSRPWSDEELASAEELRSALGTFLLGRAEHLALVNAELARSNAELDAFAYVVAHDLREPLRGIHQFADFLAEDYAEALAGEGMDHIGVVQRLATRMNSLLDSLLDYSRAGRGELEVGDVSLAELMTDVREMLHNRIASQGAEIIVGAGETRLHGDRDGLLLVLSNLVSNAVKYADGPERRVEVDVCRLEDTERGVADDEWAPEAAPLVVRVRDNGIGIPDEHRDTVFAIFRRLHGRDAYGGGTGAGLTIARRVVQRHGGELWIDRSAPGEGTAFCFYRPAGMIAVVEDADEDYIAFKRALAGRDIVRYRSGDAAFAELSRLAAEGGAWPQVRLLDLNLPGSNGMATLRRLRADPALCLLPVVMLSGSTRPEDIQAAYEAGANAYVVKPLGFAALKESLLALADFFDVVAVPAPARRAAHAPGFGLA